MPVENGSALPEGADIPTVVLEGNHHLTRAAGPKALAASSNSPGDLTQPGATEGASGGVISKGSRVRPTGADALDRGELRRLRMFHAFAALASFAVVGISVLLGGDPAARLAFWIGAAGLSACNMVLCWMTTSIERYRPTPVGILWVIGTICVQPGVYYFGPFSAAVMVDMLGIVFIALGRTRWTALATVFVCIGAHLTFGIPIALGVIRDRGVLSPITSDQSQLVFSELLIVGFLCSGYALGRWARNTNATALAELQSAMRIIGDQEQALAEVVDEEQRAKRVNEGRWTNQNMGRYRLGLVLGRGAMGEVYEAVGPDNVPAAVKLLNASSTASSAIVERFHREMEVAALLQSPHIVRVFEVSRPDAPVPYIAMERLNGMDLAARLRAENRMASDELVVLIDQVARGLEVARLAGIVHRDLKPHNLFHHEGSVWKILDFGISKVLDSEGTLTGDGIVGTPQYMAPEQASGGDVTHLADVYALGAIAYRCLTGRSPFKGKDLAELVYQVVHVAPARPGTLGGVSRTIEDVLAVAMAKDPKRRFASALSFAQALVQARRGRPVPLEVPPDAWT